jgi:hypothetical protein
VQAGRQRNPGPAPRWLARLAAVGISRCNLFLFEHNPAGRAFWAKHGWTAQADLVIMQKPLPGADAS